MAERFLAPFTPGEEHVIYAIEHIRTGKFYVGKTTKNFTSRWYEHFFQSPMSGRYNTKFGEALRHSKLTDWCFFILEVVEYKEDINAACARSYILCRESHWMDELNSIDNGFNVGHSTSDYHYRKFRKSPEELVMIDSHRVRRKAREYEWDRAHLESLRKQEEIRRNL